MLTYIGLYLFLVIALGVMASNHIDTNMEAQSLNPAVVKAIADQVSLSIQKVMEDSGMLTVCKEIKSLKTDLNGMGASINFIQDSCTEAVNKALWAENKIFELESTISDLRSQLSDEHDARL
jgi:peptidoglycan hydrolase CwlO-like protein